MTTAPDVQVKPWALFGDAFAYEVTVNGLRVGFAREVKPIQWWWSPSLHKALTGTDHRGTMDEMRAWAAGRAE